MFTNGNPVVKTTKIDGNEDVQLRITVAIGELRALQFAVKQGNNIRDRAVSANAQMKRVQEVLGNLIRGE